MIVLTRFEAKPVRKKMVSCKRSACPINSPKPIPSNQNDTLAKDEYMWWEYVLGEIQPSERYCEAAFVFRRGIRGTRRSDVPARVLDNRVCTRNNR